MRLLFISDMAHTGFGRVGREVSRRLLEAGVDIRILAINWRGRSGEVGAAMEQGKPSEQVKALIDEMDSNPIYERMITAFRQGDGMGLGLTAPAATGGLWKGWTAEAAIVVADPRAMVHRLATDGGVLGRMPLGTYNYVPIEGHEQPPFLRSVWTKYVKPVAMTEFGRKEIEALVARPVPVIQHGVSEAFRPVSPSDPGHYRGQVITSKDAAKRAFGLGDSKVILRTDRNVPRKDYPGFFRSLGPLLDRFRDAVLVVHCATVDEGGIFAEMISHLPGAYEANGDWGHPQIKFTDAHDTFRGMTDEEMRVLYNAADVYASNTGSEGWGLCGAEAAACGVPVVTTDYAAQPEVVGPGAVLVKTRGFVRNQYGSVWALADEQDFADRVEWVLTHPSKARQIGQDGMRHVRQWSWDQTATDFMNLIAP